VIVKRSNRLLILLGLLIAISGALAAVAYVAGSGGGGGGGGAQSSPSVAPTPTPGPTVPVVVATKAIPAGTIIDSSMVKSDSRQLSDLAGLPGTTYSDVNSVIGKIAGADILTGQVLVSGSNVLSPGSAIDGKSLAGSVDKGKVAIAMEVDQTNVVGTLIVPGDRVDIILTVYVDQLAISIKDAAGTQVGTGGSAVTSKLILENCKILATLLPPPTTNTTTTTTLANGSPAPVLPPTNPIVQFSDRHMIAIVEVTPEESEVIRWAQRTEQKAPQTYIDLAFALRSNQDNTTDPLSSNPGTTVPGVTFTEIAAEYGVLPPDPLGTLPSLLGNKIQW